MGICLNCFYNNLREYVCPKCGFDHREMTRKPLMLPPYTTLMNGRYLIGRILGAGGFGITYKAYDNYNKKICAIKEYAPLNIAERTENSLDMHEVGKDKLKIYYHCKKRFYEEAKSLYDCRKIPEIVSIETYFEENNTAYFAMEFIGESNLRKQMRQYGGRLPLELAVDIFTKVGMGLDRVHKEVGIFHRDISPENIMLGNDGRTVKLIDFGSAKFIARSEAEKKSGLTVVLKPGYAPPEQYYSSGKQGTFTDVYALGATFYYVICGEMLPDATKRALGHETYIRLKDRDIEGMTDRISDAVDRAVNLDANQRTQSILEFINEISADRRTDRQETKREEMYVAQNSHRTVDKPVNPHRGRPFVRIVKGEGVGTQWYLPYDKFVIVGRAGLVDGVGADLVVTATDREISRHHIKVMYNREADIFLVQELSSTNGTTIRSEELKNNEEKRIRKGEHIILGPNAMELEVGVE